MTKPNDAQATRAASPKQAEPVARVTGAMVDRFLSWRLPPDFSPDCGISFKRVYNESSPFGPQNHDPVGTNLLTADQARAMLEHVVGCSAEPLDERQIIKLANDLPGVGECISGVAAIAFTRAIEALINPTPAAPTKVAPTDRVAQSEAQSPALLFAHDDGRYAVAHAGAAFLVGDPAWHRVGPVEVHGAQSPQGAPVAYLHPITHPNWLDVCEKGSPGAFPVFAALQGGEAAQASTASDLTDAIMHAVTSCSHSIDREQIVLRFDAKNPGHNALNQLHRRIGAAIAQAGAPGRSEHAEPVAQPDGHLHDDGYFTWAPGKRPRERDDVAGWRAPFYLSARAAPQPLLHGAPESARQPLTMIQKSALFDTECAVTFTVWDDFIAGIEAAERAHAIDSATAMKAAGARE